MHNLCTARFNQPFSLIIDLRERFTNQTLIHIANDNTH